MHGLALTGEVTNNTFLQEIGSSSPQIQKHWSTTVSSALQSVFHLQLHFLNLCKCMVWHLLWSQFSTRPEGCLRKKKGVLVKQNQCLLCRYSGFVNDCKCMIRHLFCLAISAQHHSRQLNRGVCIAVSVSPAVTFLYIRVNAWFGTYCDHSSQQEWRNARHIKSFRVRCNKCLFCRYSVFMEHCKCMIRHMFCLAISAQLFRKTKRQTKPDPKNGPCWELVIKQRATDVFTLIMSCEHSWWYLCLVITVSTTGFTTISQEITLVQS